MPECQTLFKQFVDGQILSYAENSANSLWFLKPYLRLLYSLHSLLALALLILILVGVRLIMNYIPTFQYFLQVLSFNDKRIIKKQSDTHAIHR